MPIWCSRNLHQCWNQLLLLNIVETMRSCFKLRWIKISGGPLSALTCCVNVKLLSGDKKISPLIYSQSWVGSWVYTTQAMMTFTLILQNLVMYILKEWGIIYSTYPCHDPFLPSCLFGFHGSKKRQTRNTIRQRHQILQVNLPICQDKKTCEQY